MFNQDKIIFSNYIYYTKTDTKDLITHAKGKGKQEKKREQVILEYMQCICNNLTH